MSAVLKAIVEAIDSFKPAMVRLIKVIEIFRISIVVSTGNNIKRS